MTETALPIEALMPRPSLGHRSETHEGAAMSGANSILSALDSVSKGNSRAKPLPLISRRSNDGQFHSGESRRRLVDILPIARETDGNVFSVL
jgi:hypothetical protein